MGHGQPPHLHRQPPAARRGHPLSPESLGPVAAGRARRRAAGAAGPGTGKRRWDALGQRSLPPASSRGCMGLFLPASQCVFLLRCWILMPASRERQYVALFLFSNI